MIVELWGRGSGSPLVESVWSARSEGGGHMTSLAVCSTELVFTRQGGELSVMLRGPETWATTAPVPHDAQFFGVTLGLGVHLPGLPPTRLRDRHAPLAASGRHLWLGDRALPLPGPDDAEAFVERLERLGLLRREPQVQVLLQGERPADPASLRRAQRRFLEATGLSLRATRTIERARLALERLQAGHAVADVVHELGYTDQAHLTRLLRRLMGRTPARTRDVDWHHAPLGGVAR
ncbi:AraC family transcriptional regulator (plasmid) [Deinococcus metallilatus]|uniref:AraC family transcriptional regulator n=1 Tax=Deinococcus metallilatus TaxID=1211322 RepID=A0AAJ5F856_9DEIO|nr:helix-turn-helix domain-containing protein [Deinococcus metallilatus]MBB5295708.1 hypothetical protein [Deinococcus metallilatus]QBY06844.1 AraC family transcriptional regulator [Deinococcus metallilatus]TLK32233.1 AraC family transcriptional regulator [Deinococcus metallilatus]GMA14239.1 AraC family transcriptional regulator [Deinococcus metallilatus]